MLGSRIGWGCKVGLCRDVVLCCGGLIDCVRGDECLSMFKFEGYSHIGHHEFIPEDASPRRDQRTGPSATAE